MRNRKDIGSTDSPFPDSLMTEVARTTCIENIVSKLNFKIFKVYT